jgi:hypothetical protein
MSAAARKLLPFAIALLSLCFAYLLIKTWQWPLISDAMLMHYVVFLEHHGMTPYQQIIDVNMPGAYLVDSAVIQLFGSGAYGFRVFDYALMILACAAFVALAGRRGFYFGLLAGLLFSILHIADGVAQEGQRDFVMAVLLLLGYVALFVAVRRSSAAWLSLFGVACGVAATIKPQAAIIALILVPCAAYLVAERGTLIPLLVWGTLGALTPIAFTILWLARLHALGAWVHLCIGLSLYHAHMARHSLWFLLCHAIPSQLLMLAIPALILMFLSKDKEQWPQLFVLTGVGFGFLSFCVQGKAYPYHRYPLIAFLLLFIAMQLQQALALSSETRGGKAPKIVAWVLTAYAVLWLGPSATARALRYDWRSQPSLYQLEADLQRAGDHPLSGTVQCMDTMAGCITVLQRVQIVQATGFLYDCYFFAPGKSSVKHEMRKRFLSEIEHKAPRIFVITDQWCLNLPGGYAKLADWPEFSQFLTSKYTLAEERIPQPWDHRYRATWPFGYRIYILK